MALSGDNSPVNINSIDNSANTISKQSLDFATLAAELAKLRKALLERAQSPEHYTAIGAIASAETKSGDASKVKRALSALGIQVDSHSVAMVKQGLAYGFDRFDRARVDECCVS
jgi:hypothetical protein